MTINDYQQECLRTGSGTPDCIYLTTGADSKKYARLLEGLMGLNGEAGECIDIFKKNIFQGHRLDVEHLAKELGDVAWYLAISADAIGYDLETIFQMNVDKLQKRYPNGFDTELSKHRDRDDI